MTYTSLREGGCWGSVRRGEFFDAETSMREQLGNALTVGPRQAIQSIVNS